METENSEKKNHQPYEHFDMLISTSEAPSLNDGLVLQVDNLVFGNVMAKSLSNGFRPEVGPYEIIPVHLAGGVTVSYGWFPPGPAPFPADQLRGELAAALQRFLEGHPELPVEVGVDQGVEGRVEVAHPEDQRHHPTGTVACGGSAEGGDDVPATRAFVQLRVII